MFQLMVSHNCGMTYGRDREAETIEELEPRMQQLDEEMLRWYLEEDGEPTYERVCGIHAGLLALVRSLRDEVAT